MTVLDADNLANRRYFTQDLPVEANIFFVPSLPPSLFFLTIIAIIRLYVIGLLEADDENLVRAREVVLLPTIDVQRNFDRAAQRVTYAYPPSLAPSQRLSQNRTQTRVPAQFSWGAERVCSPLRQPNTFGDINVSILLLVSEAVKNEPVGLASALWFHKQIRRQWSTSNKYGRYLRCPSRDTDGLRRVRVVSERRISGELYSSSSQSFRACARAVAIPSKTSQCSFFHLTEKRQRSRVFAALDD